MALGKKLKDVLKEKNMTVKELSKLTDIPATTLYSFISRDSETGKFDFLNKICDCLDIKLTDLLEFEEDTRFYVSPRNVTLSKDNTIEERCTFNERLILDFFRRLNFNGQDNAIYYTEYLSEKPEYRKEDTPE